MIKIEKITYGISTIFGFVYSMTKWIIAHLPDWLLEKVRKL